MSPTSQQSNNNVNNKNEGQKSILNEFINDNEFPQKTTSSIILSTTTSTISNTTCSTASTKNVNPTEFSCIMDKEPQANTSSTNSSKIEINININNGEKDENEEENNSTVSSLSPESKEDISLEKESTKLDELNHLSNNDEIKTEINVNDKENDIPIDDNKVVNLPDTNVITGATNTSNAPVTATNNVNPIKKVYPTF